MQKGKHIYKLSTKSERIICQEESFHEWHLYCLTQLQWIMLMHSKFHTNQECQKIGCHGPSQKSKSVVHSAIQNQWDLERISGFIWITFHIAQIHLLQFCF